MGEYADMAIDSMMEYDYQQLNGTFDPDDDPYWNPFTGRWSRFKARPKTCKRCGATNLWWELYNTRWRLVEENRDVHQCQLSFKKAFEALKKSDDYNAYLDTIPWPTEADFRS